MKPKRELLRIFTALALIAVLLMTGCVGCAPAEPAATEAAEVMVRVGVQAGKGYEVAGDSVRSIPSGGSASFEILPRDGCRIIGFSYEDYEQNGNVYTFRNLRYATVIEVFYTEIGEGTSPDPTATAGPGVTPSHAASSGYPTQDPAYANSICYVFNGGVHRSVPDQAEMIVFPDTSHHKRVNVITAQGDLTRPGCTLNGWNTEPDGSGTHISLGSRATLNPNGALVLYAEWSPWSPAENFEFTVSGKKAKITAYHGEETVISVPAELGGAPVAEIAAGTFKNLSVQKVVLPSTMKTVNTKAFQNCDRLKTLHFFDTVSSISDHAFENCKELSTLYINALKPPYFIKSNGKVEAYDSFLLSGKKRIVFFGGSSCLYGIDAYRARAYFQGDYDVINLGWTAPRNAIFQVEIIRALLRDGDIFVHAPEYYGSMQLMRNVAMGASAWQVIESNLDLFSHVDIRTMTGVFSSYSKFTAGKDSLKNPCTYDDYCTTMDDLGYLCTNRKTIHARNWAPEGSIAIKASLITDVAIERLRWLYEGMVQNGAKVYLTYPPLDINYLDAQSKKAAVQQGYMDRYASIGYPVLGKLNDFFYTGEWFYNSEFHLVTAGAQMHTDRVVSFLAERMKQDGIWEKRKGA